MTRKKSNTFNTNLIQKKVYSKEIYGSLGEKETEENENKNKNIEDISKSNNKVIIDKDRTLSSGNDNIKEINISMDLIDSLDNQFRF